MPAIGSQGESALVTAVNERLQGALSETMRLSRLVEDCRRISAPSSAWRLPASIIEFYGGTLDISKNVDAPGFIIRLAAAA